MPRSHRPRAVRRSRFGSRVAREAAERRSGAARAAPRAARPPRRGARLRRGRSPWGRTLAEMSPKTLTGAELDLNDAPARDAELFLVDGNNLAYRAFFALPEELATTEGFPTNALLGFTNML